MEKLHYWKKNLIENWFNNDNSVGLKKEDAKIRARWRVGVGEIAGRVGWIRPPSFTGIKPDQNWIDDDEQKEIWKKRVGQTNKGRLKKALKTTVKYSRLFKLKQEMKLWKG